MAFGATWPLGPHVFDAAMQASVMSSTPIISFLPFGPCRSDCQSSDDVQSSQVVESLGIISGLTLFIFFRTHGPRPMITARQ